MNTYEGVQNQQNHNKTSTSNVGQQGHFEIITIAAVKNNRNCIGRVGRVENGANEAANHGAAVEEQNAFENDTMPAIQK